MYPSRWQDELKVFDRSAMCWLPVCFFFIEKIQREKFVPMESRAHRTVVRWNTELTSLLAAHRWPVILNYYFTGGRVPVIILSKEHIQFISGLYASKGNRNRRTDLTKYLRVCNSWNIIRRDACKNDSDLFLRPFLRKCSLYSLHTDNEYSIIVLVFDLREHQATCSLPAFRYICANKFQREKFVPMKTGHGRTSNICSLQLPFAALGCRCPAHNCSCPDSVPYKLHCIPIPRAIFVSNKQMFCAQIRSVRNGRKVGWECGWRARCWCWCIMPILFFNLNFSNVFLCLAQKYLSLCTINFFET